MEDKGAGAVSAASVASEDGAPKDRHEPRGRKPNDQLPPSRAREVQRAFRLRRAEHLAVLEERISLLETENSQLRALLALPDADRGKIGSGPTGRGKSLRDGGVPMSERVRARKEARARERAARGIVEPESSEMSDGLGRDVTASPGGGAGGASMSVGMSGGQPSGGRASAPPVSASSVSVSVPGLNSAGTASAGVGSSSNNVPFFSPPPTDLAAQFAFNLPANFHLPMSPDGAFDYLPDAGGVYKSPGPANSFSLFNLFDTDRPASAPLPQQQQQQQQQAPPPPAPMSAAPSMQPTPSAGPASASRPPESPISPPLPTAPAAVPQPELLTRLKACCHVSDSHVVNDPGLLIFATRLCQSTACGFGGHHGPDSVPASDGEYLSLDDGWRVLRATLDPAGGDGDGENRMNTGRMASELVTRAAASRGAGGWIVCRYREGMSIKRSLVAGLVQGFGGSFE